MERSSSSAHAERFGDLGPGPANGHGLSDARSLKLVSEATQTEATVLDLRTDTARGQA